MPIPIACPCGRTVNAPEKAVGKKVRCMYCGRALDVPAAAAPAPAADDAYELLPEEPRRERSPEAPFPRRREDRPIIDSRPTQLPVAAILLAAFGLLDSLGIGAVGVVVVFVSALVGESADQATHQEKAVESA